MSIFSVDVESDGPYPPQYSMVSFGAVLVDPTLSTTFYGTTKPISDTWDPEALAISGISREEHLQHDDPVDTMTKFAAWIKLHNKDGRPVFLADNPGYDFAWMNYYFHVYNGANPFGWSSRRIGDLYAGIVGDYRAKWRHLCVTKQDHNPVNDAKSNAEAFLKMLDMMKKGVRA